MSTRLAVRTGSGLAVASLGLTLDNLRRVRSADPTDRPPAGSPEAAEAVALLLPVRDEVVLVDRCVHRLVAAARHWPGPARVVVLDDGSSDGTTERLVDLSRRRDFGGLLEVLTGTPPPAGWLGKPWACAQLARAAEGADVLVFVDADVSLAAPGLTATVTLLREAGLDLVCPYPRQEARGAAERLLQPLLQWSWFATLPLGLAERSPRPSLTAANGQLLAVDAAAYARVGGHGAVRDAVLEDIGLLRAVKAAGGRGVVADGSAIASCRMYDGWHEVRAGYTKSLWAAFGGRAGAVGVQGFLLLTHVVPAVAALRGSPAGAVGYLASVAARVLVGRRTGARVWPDALAHPVSVALLAALTGDSVLRSRRPGARPGGRHRGRGAPLQWKGRPVQVAAS